MFTELPWCFVIVAARAGAVYHVVGSRALALAGHMGGAISLQVHVTRQDQLDGAVNATGALWQFGPGLLGNLCHCLTPYLPRCGLKPRSTCLFPRDRTNCYHCFALSSTKGVVPGGGEFAAPHRLHVYNSISPMI